MTEPAFLTAHFTPAGDTIHADFHLTLDNHVEEVWAALTEPQWLARWLAPGEIELSEGGSARLDFGESGAVIESRVTAFAPQRLLEYSWSRPGEPLRPLRWSLEPIGPTTLLTLRLSMPAKEDAARAAAGFAAHLEMLQTALIGVPTKFPFAVFKEARDAYREQVAQLSAERRTVQVSS
ncbi:MAG TPA: SRPBCC domain-containing protein [Phenylobacterium sp.]|jgi:uncharacterized protein YndB with AHSA1/START domain|nr:SRPBCC domain-containing protein [Phenylobacterium sp.]